MTWRFWLWPAWAKLTGIIAVAVLAVGGATAALVAANPVSIGHPSASSAGSPAPTSAPPADEPGVSTYLCQGTTNDTLLQWQDSSGYLSGTFQQATLSGSPPDEQVTPSQGNVTGTLNDSAITLQIGDLPSAYGTLSGGQLNINITQQDGTIQAATCNQASIDDWNNAVSGLNTQAASDNGQEQQAEASASASASHDQAVTYAQNSLSGDVSTLQSDSSSLNNDSTLSGDISTMKSDYGTEQSDFQTEKSDGCPGASGDASAVASDASAIGSDQTALNADIGSLRSNEIKGIYDDVTAIKNDLTSLGNLGVTTPGTDPSSALDAGRQALKNAASAISWAQGQASGIVQQANGLATQAENYARSIGCG